MTTQRTLATIAAIGALLGVACGGAEEAMPHKAQSPLPTPAPAPRDPASGSPIAAAKRVIEYPAAKIEDHKDVFFGVPVSDPYRWLEDAKSRETRRWMDAEVLLARGYLAALPGREELSKRLRELFYYDSVSAPLRRGKRVFLSRRHKGDEKGIVYYRDGEKGPEKVLLDPNAMSSPGNNVSIGHWVPSYDGKRVAYTVHKNNADDATLYVKNVETGKVSDIDVIPGAKYAVPSFTPSGDGFYYVRLPSDPAIAPADLPGHSEIRFHKIGEDPAKDELVREKNGDPRTEIDVSLSRDGHFLFTHVFHNFDAEADVYYRDLRGSKAGAGRQKDEQKEWRPLSVGKKARFEVIAHKDQLYILTDDGAPRGHIFKVDARDTARERWQEIVKEPADAVIESMRVIGGKLTLVAMKNAASELSIAGLDGKPFRKVELPGIGGSWGFVGNPDDDEAYFYFTSFTRPTEIYRTSIKTGETKLYAGIELPIDPSLFEVKQIFYPSKDGTKVSMFLVHKKGIRLDGSAPLLMSGYGGFGINMQPYFSSSLYPWLEAGGVFALPNLRGGGEYGKEWHEGGMKTRKQNVFDDLIAGAEHLIKLGYTSSSRLAIRGGSNGGLLVAAALVQRPDLFRAVICEVPVIDMIRFPLTGDGKTWIGEYGSIEKEDELKALLAYSPYHNVKEGVSYPSVLVLSADSDDRVDPMHARKLVAVLQAKASGERPILLRIEMNAGHGGADMAKQAVDAGVDVYAFLMKELGMVQGEKGGGAKP